MHSRKIQYYTSRSALPLLLWATALSAHNASGNCVVGDSNQCYIVVAPTIADDRIQVDGVKGTTEWLTAKYRDFVGDFAGRVHFLRSETAVYLLVSIEDGSGRPNDFLNLYIDARHDGAMKTDDIRLRVGRGLGIAPPELMKSVGASGLSAWIPSTAGSLAAALSSNTEWTVELKISASELGVGQLPVEFGFAVSSNDQPNDRFSSWPSTMTVISAEPTTWADIKLSQTSKPAVPNPPSALCVVGGTCATTN